MESLAELLRGHSVPLSMSPVNVLSSDNPSNNPEEPWHLSPRGHGAIDCSSLSVSTQTIPYPPRGPCIRSMSLQFGDKNVVWDRVQCFAQVQADVVSHLNTCLAFIGFYQALIVTF